MSVPKKLIEVALPLEAINRAAAREKSIRHGHPSTLHLWWARRPLAAARAIIFSQMVDDPSTNPEKFPTEQAQKVERQRLFRIIEELVKWENTTNEKILSIAREEIWKSWRMTCKRNASHPRAKELYNPTRLPAFHDPFAGGGSLPLEAQRLGLEAYASDLNPVAVLICKAMIEIPPKFSNKPPVNPESRKQGKLSNGAWIGVKGLAEDVRYYGQLIREEAEKRIGHLYPKVEITKEMAKNRPDLKPIIGHHLTVIAWLWARTVKSPNPLFSNVDVPLVTTFILATKPGKEAYVEPIIEGKSYRFTVRVGKSKDVKVTRKGTKIGGSGSSFFCLMSKTPMSFEYLRSEAKAGRMGARLMAVVAEGDRKRIYLSPTPEMESIALSVKPIDVPEISLPEKALGFRVQEYGMKKWSDLFTSRQLNLLTTFSNLVFEICDQVRNDAVIAGMLDDGKSLNSDGTGAQAYADAVGIYLGLVLDRAADYGSNLCSWHNGPKMEAIRNTFGRQAIPMVWDFAEGNPFSGSSGNWLNNVEWVVKTIKNMTVTSNGFVQQIDAINQDISYMKIISTDPPYYDNIGYADLSDFFYIWLRRTLKKIYPDIFSTLSVPKTNELVATPFRHGSIERAETFFLEGMTKAMQRLAIQALPAFPITIYYAFKQSENNSEDGISSTGWETFLDAVIRAGFSVSGTWPIRTELSNKVSGMGHNMLASSIVLVCRRRAENTPLATHREFLTTLKKDIPSALRKLQEGSIAPVDFPQASIGPGIAVFSRYSKVLKADGSPMSVRTALQLINQELDSFLRQEESEMDRDTQFCIAWFEQFGMTQGDFGAAETLSKAKNTSVGGMAKDGILQSKGGKVALTPRSEYPDDWDPVMDTRLTLWECTHHLIKRHQEGGEAAAAELATRLGTGKSEDAKNLAYRLYLVCEKRRWADDARAYNELVTAWPEIQKKAAGLVGEGPQKRLDV